MHNVRWFAWAFPKTSLSQCYSGKDMRQRKFSFFFRFLNELLTRINRQGLIAVNYPARDFGIGRHCNLAEAKKLCPGLIVQHVATWREGDDKWAYRLDSAANIATDKVSLDPYRVESRKILTLVKDSLPPDLQRVEKASVDEVFLDLSAHVRSVLLDRFPELKNPPPYDDPTEKLPLPGVAALDWQADALVDLDEEEEIQDPDWDDVVILLGSEIVRDVRARIRRELGYTCSAGIAHNKMVSKLASAHKKPNSQTVVRSRAVHSFLAGIKLTKIRNLGGKLGDQVVSMFNTEDTSKLLEIPLEQLNTKLGEETGLWLYNTLRGIDQSEVNSRTQIKSMLSAKSFRPSINSRDQAVKWLRIFVADIYARLVEEGVLDNKRRPRTINLHHRCSGQTRSKQCPIPQGRSLDEGTLLRLSKDLLDQILADGKSWPCANISLSVGGFEEGIKGNMGIGGFLVRGEDALVTRPRSPPEKRPIEENTSSNKRLRAEANDIQRFFSKSTSIQNSITHEGDAMESAGPETEGKFVQRPITDFFCPRCNICFDDAQSLQSHNDWHMAKDLQEVEDVRGSAPEPSGAPRASHSKGSVAHSKRGRGASKIERGQKKLNFG